MPSTKLGEFTGVRQGESLSMAGIQVQLWDSLGELECCTTTDRDGRYGFMKLNPMLKYHVKFTYDGMRFEATQYTNSLAGDYSTAWEMDRRGFNDKFDQIESTPGNYGDREMKMWKRAFRIIYEVRKSFW